MGLEKVVKPNLREVLKALGPKRFLKVCELIGNAPVWFPKKANLETFILYERIAVFAKRGHRRSVICAYLGVPEETVRTALRFYKRHRF